MPRNRGPTHLLAHAGDRRSLCGKKDAYPRELVGFADAHVRGHGMVVCSACEAALRELSGGIPSLREVEPDVWSISDRD